jgi:hypothetical protein
MIELNVACNSLSSDKGYSRDMAGLIALTNAIETMDALSVTNFVGDQIGKEQLAKLQRVLSTKQSLVSLCGIYDDATEADLSNAGMYGVDAVALAAELPNKRVLATLNLAENNLGELMQGALPEGWKSKDGDDEPPWVRVEDAHEQDEYPGEEKCAGAVAIADAIKNNSASWHMCVAVWAVRGRSGYAWAQWVVAAVFARPRVGVGRGRKRTASLRRA